MCACAVVLFLQPLLEHKSVEDFDLVFGGALTHSAVLSDGTTVCQFEGGDNQDVTFDSAAAYAQWLCSVRLRESEAQVAAMCLGMSEVVPLAALRLYTWRELELQLCGRPEVDLASLKRHTEYATGVNRGAKYLQ